MSSYGMRITNQTIGLLVLHIQCLDHLATLTHLHPSRHSALQCNGHPANPVRPPSCYAFDGDGVLARLPSSSAAMSRRAFYWPSWGRGT